MKLEKIPQVRTQTSNLDDDPRTALRKKLLRRLIWKVPLIFLLMVFAVWWQIRNESGTEAPTGRSAKATLFAGAWKGEVKYPWSDRYTEQFFFQPEGDKVFGTASFLGKKRGIEDGKIIGETITFSVAFEEISGSTTQLRRNHYEGILDGETIRLRIIIDAAVNVPVEAVLARNGLKP